MSRKRRRWIIGSCLAAIAAVALAITFWPTNPLRSKARRAWKDQAIAKIQRRIDDKAWLDGELARIKSLPKLHDLDWIAPEMLLARNGEWIVCQSVAGKERQEGITKDLFIGRASDGKWYYSTFHFCVDKVSLHMDWQPESLAQIVDGYWLVPFDGKSDDCLKETWTVGPAGADKWAATAPAH